MESLFYDLRHAVRQLRHRPLLAAVAVLSIAVGIGANTAILSAASALLFTAPPGLDDPSRIVEVSRTMGGRSRDTFSWPELLDLREGAADAFEGLAAWSLRPLSYATGTGTDPERVSGMGVSGNYFDIMGVQPLRGRFFTADEDRVPMRAPVAVVSEAFWRDHLGAAPDVVGRTLSLNRHTFTIIGVAPASFRGHIYGVRPDVYLPMMMQAVMHPGFNAWNVRWASWFTIVGRLKPGVSIATANAAVQTVFRRLPQTTNDPRNARSAAVDAIGLVPAAGRAPTGAFLGMLMGLVGIILMVTCANVAGMLLARAAARSREIAIRLALGSSRARLVRQLLMEALLLFGIGGGLGLLIATWSTGLLTTLNVPSPTPITIDVSPDLRVLGVGLLLALVTGVIFGLVPALQSTRHDLADAMKTSAGAVIGRGGRLRRAFVMGQIGLSMVLLLSAGLFLRSLQRAAGMPTGFDQAGVETTAFDLSIDGYDSLRGRVFLAQLEANLRAAPGVTGVGFTTDLPLDLGISEQPAYVPGSPAADDKGRVQSAFNAVNGGYFDALRIPLRSGRVFDARDVAGASDVVVISRTFADQVWPGAEPLGQSLRLGSEDGTPLTVIGVVEDVKNQTLMESVEPTMYLPLTQQYVPGLTLLVRGAPGRDAAATLRRVVRETDPALSVSAIIPLESVTSFGLLPQRLAAGITTALGVLALILSALGVYGVVAFGVAQRTREIGIRMALGAHRGNVIRLVLRGGMGLALPGLVFGLAGGGALSVVLRSFLLGVGPADPVTFVSIPLLLLAAVALACWAPARRAAAVEPSSALRAE